MSTDDDGNLDFADDPEVAYTVPPDQMFMWGLRIWRSFDANGEPKVYWHIDGGPPKAVELAGTVELVKAALIDQQIKHWRDEDEGEEGAGW